MLSHQVVVKIPFSTRGFQSEDEADRRQPPSSDESFEPYPDKR